MQAIFLVCLVGGLGATALLAALSAFTGTVGHSMGHLHAGGGSAHVHAGQLPAGSAVHGHTLPAHSVAHQAMQVGHTHTTDGNVPAVHGANPLAAAAGWTLSWLNPLTIAAGVLWFGGAGTIMDLFASAFALPVAVVAALLGATLVRALMTAFGRADTVPLSADATGALGTLSAPIREDVSGEVIYTLEGLHRSAAARSLDGAPLPRGTRVVIVRREHGIAYVSPLDPLDPLSSLEPATPKHDPAHPVRGPQ